MSVIQILAGLVLLVVGGDLLVRWASRLALGWGIPSLVVGLTVVAFGTSAPELAVSLAAAWKGNAEIALGNVVGSNIFNVLLILGLSAVVAPLVVQRSMVRRELPVMLGSAVLVALMGIDGQIDRAEGVVLFAALVGFIAWLIRSGRREAAASETTTTTAAPANVPLLLGGIALSLGLLVLGSRLLVAGAVSIAQAFGVSELVIGLTIVAAGTSLPEVAASVAATLRGERDIAIGNVVGSNIFNVLCVLGGSAILSPASLPVPAAALGFDIPLMVAVSLLCVPVFLTGSRISRTEGVLFLGLYGGYTALLVITGGGAGPARSVALTGFLVATAAVLAWEFYRSRRPAAINAE